MRARNIKPGFWKNEDLVEMGFETRLLFVGLWMLADREGRLEDRPKRIKMEVFPADNVDVGACLEELESFGLVERYQADGKRVVCIPNFTVHQSPHHSEKRSDLPNKNGEYDSGKAADSEKSRPTKAVDSGKSRESHGEPTVGSRNHHGRNRPDSLNPDSLNPDSLNPDSIGDRQATADTKQAAKREQHDKRFAEFWDAYPQKKGKAKALQIWKSKKLDRIADDIIADVQNRTQMDVQWQDKQYIPHGSTYLSQERWLDEITTSSQVGNRSPGNQKRDGFTEWFERNGMDANGNDAGTVIDPDEQHPGLTLLHGGAR